MHPCGPFREISSYFRYRSINARSTNQSQDASSVDIVTQNKKKKKQRHICMSIRSVYHRTIDTNTWIVAIWMLTLTLFASLKLCTCTYYDTGHWWYHWWTACMWTRFSEQLEELVLCLRSRDGLKSNLAVPWLWTSNAILNIAILLIDRRRHQHRRQQPLSTILWWCSGSSRRQSNYIPTDLQALFQPMHPSYRNN